MAFLLLPSFNDGLETWFLFCDSHTRIISWVQTISWLSFYAYKNRESSFTEIGCCKRGKNFKALLANCGKISSCGHQKAAKCIESNFILIFLLALISTRSSFVWSFSSIKSRLKRNGPVFIPVNQTHLHNRNILQKTDEVPVNVLLFESRYAPAMMW